MNNTLKYTLVGALVFVLVFFVALPFFGVNAAPWATGCDWNRGGGTWGMGSGMMGGFGLFGGLMMLGMLLYPLLVLGLIATGIYWLVKRLTKQNQPQEKG